MIQQRSSIIQKIGIDVSRMSESELKELADFMTTQIDQIAESNPADICYAAYVGMAVSGSRMKIVDKLVAKILLAYRKLLIQWFEFALVKRANVGGGGSGIKKIEKGLSDFVEAIPEIMLNGANPKLTHYVEDNEYIQSGAMDPVGFTILNTIGRDAFSAGMMLKRVKTGIELNQVPVEWDEEKRLFYIPKKTKGIYELRNSFKADGFRWDQFRKEWILYEREMTPQIRQKYNVVKPTSIPNSLDIRFKTWFWDEWLPGNIGRFTKVFSDYAKSSQTSYKMVFSVSGHSVSVKFTRDISNAWKAIEELRYRYIGRQGRESWLEVMDRFTELVKTTSPSKLPHIIDRMNNLEHSNGMFLEHFPSSVKSWYGGFLNNKYHTGKADTLALNINDRDLKDILIEVTSEQFGHARPQDFRFELPVDYTKMVKELEGVGEKINWRERGYPKYKGYFQVDRFDDAVQNGLDALQKLDENRKRILSTEVSTQRDVDIQMGEADDYYEEHQRLVAELEHNLQRMQDRWRQTYEVGDALADRVLSRSFPKDFIQAYPYAVAPDKDVFRRFMSSTRLNKLALQMRQASRPGSHWDPWVVNDKDSKSKLEHCFDYMESNIRNDGKLFFMKYRDISDPPKAFELYKKLLSALKKRDRIKARKFANLLMKYDGYIVDNTAWTFILDNREN